MIRKDDIGACLREVFPPLDLHGEEKGDDQLTEEVNEAEDDPWPGDPPAEPKEERYLSLVLRVGGPVAARDDRLLVKEGIDDPNEGERRDDDSLCSDRADEKAEADQIDREAEVERMAGCGIRSFLHEPHRRMEGEREPSSPQIEGDGAPAGTEQTPKD